jgi:hypothetical protein
MLAVLHRSGNLAGDTGGGAVFAEMGSNATFTNCLAVNNTLFAAGKARAGVRTQGISRRGARVTHVCDACVELCTMLPHNRVAHSSWSRAPRRSSST